MAQQYLLASFDRVDEAVDVFNRLTNEAGYADEDISIMTTDTVRKEFVDRADVDEGDIGVGEGAATGAVAGGLIGLLVSAVPLAIGGIPALIVVGPVAAALGLSGVAGTVTTGAVAGALTGGIVGALDNLGVDRDVATRYEETVREGGLLVMVPVRGNEDEVRTVLLDGGAEDVQVARA